MFEARRSAAAAGARKRARVEQEVQGVQVLAAAHVVDARQLVKLAREQYAAYQAQVPSLPDFDARDQHGAKVVACSLDIVTGDKGQHVDRGLFNLVSGDATSISNLKVDEHSWPVSAFPDGAVLAIQGYTAQLLDSALVAPLHSAALQPGQQLVVLAVRVACEEMVIPGRGGLRLQAALAATFGGGVAKAEHEQHVEAGHERPAPAAGGSDAVAIQLTVRDQAGGEVWFRVRPTARICQIMEAYCARKRVAHDAIRLLYDGSAIYGDITVDELGMEDGDVCDAVLVQQGD